MHFENKKTKTSIVIAVLFCTDRHSFFRHAHDAENVDFNFVAVVDAQIFKVVGYLCENELTNIFGFVFLNDVSQL